jgi:hypothetical protein
MNGYPQAQASPDLTSFVSDLTSPDPKVQELAVAPAVRARSGEAPGVLPAGSTIVLVPATWEMSVADEATEILRASIDATVTRPGEPSKDFSLLLVQVGDQWLLYDSRPL